VAAGAPGRRPIIAANWKMHKTHLESIKAVQQLSYLIDNKTTDQVDVVICPPFTSLRSLQTLFDADRLPYSLAAQDVHWEEKGALTGEISPRMLAALNCRYVIVGHSERREFFGDTDDRVARKTKAVFAAGMVPILCVGESLEERDSGRTEDKVVTQVKAALGGLSETQVAQVVIAYEPIWAIGTGRNSNPQDAGEVVTLIRNTIASMFSAAPAASARVQYGGSVKPGNIREFMAHPEIDGALVGGASLDPEEFALIVRYRG
jgi:triosephosphate isomerase (TIM)